MSTILIRSRDSRATRCAVALVLVGAVGACAELASAPARTWSNLLVNGFYLLSLALSALLFLACQRLTGARWSASLRRVPEAIAAILPAASVLMVLVLLLGSRYLYPWSRPGAFAHEPALAGKISYLQPSYVFLRMGAMLLLWNVFARLFRRDSRAQDRSPGESLRYHHRLNRKSAAYIVSFALSFTLGSYDWLLSLDPSWSSTIFAIYVFAGLFVQGIAAITLAVVLLSGRFGFRGLADSDQLRDLGRMLFAFSTFWAYIWTCQYLLVWYGNVPEEVTHYVTRTSAPWLWLFLLNVGLNWLVPFSLLMSGRAKSNRRRLIVVTVTLLAGHWLDLYLIVMPATSPAPRIGIWDPAIFVGYAALAWLLFTRTLREAPLVPLHDPILAADRAGSHDRNMPSLLAEQGR